MIRGNSKPDLSREAAIRSLPDRTAPYWNILEYCRHIGIQKAASQLVYWVARIRRIDGGYTQTRLAIAIDGNGWVTNREEAIELARVWFTSPIIKEIASTPYPVGVTRTLRYDKKVTGFTVGDAMRDYIEWKRIAATRSHFESKRPVCPA